MDKVPSIGFNDALIDAVCERGEYRLVRDIAAPLPMAVIGDMLVVLPEERDMLLRWSDDLVWAEAPRRRDRDQKLMDTFAAPGVHHEEIKRRRADPTDDLFSILVNAEVRPAHDR